MRKHLTNVTVTANHKTQQSGAHCSKNDHRLLLKVKILSISKILKISQENYDNLKEA